MNSRVKHIDLEISYGASQTQIRHHHDGYATAGHGRGVWQSSHGYNGETGLPEAVTRNFEALVRVEFDKI